MDALNEMPAAWPEAQAEGAEPDVGLAAAGCAGAAAGVAAPLADEPDEVPEPDSPPAAGLPDVAEAVVLPDSADFAGAVAADGAPLLRKSVTYQPEPLSWKPAAVTCLENVS